MASFNQFNSMPENRSDGARDVSNPSPILGVRTKPSHLPVWFLFTEWGPTNRNMTDGPGRNQLYGSKSFDPQSKYFNHQTMFSNTVNATGNQGIYQRVLAPDATKAAMRLWLDVLETQVPEYVRGTDGKYLLDQDGNKQETGETITGYILKIVKTPIGAQTGGEFGQASQMVGDQTNPVTLNQSTRYPFLDIPAQFFGERGNSKGFRMWAPTAGARTEVDPELIQDNKAYPYIFSCLDNADDLTQNIMTVNGVAEITAVMRRDQVKKSVRQQISFEPRFHNQWNDTSRQGMPPLYGPFAETHLYYDTLEEVLLKFYNAEVPYIDQFSDFSGEGEEEIHRFNFIGGKSSRGVPYHSFLINRTAANAEPMSDISTVWAVGGSDGDVSLDMFDKLVRAEVVKYGNIDMEVTDDRLGNPESDIWDSGFSVETKEAMLNFIGLRKDTFVNLTTHVVNGKTLNAEEESSLASALFTRAQMFPESTEYATPTVRCAISCGDGELIASNEYPRRLPLSLQLAQRAGEYMGAADGKWREAFAYSNGERANITLFKNLNVTWRPVTQRRRDWNNGLIYPQSKDIGLWFFPALRTVYSVQTSIFTSYFTAKGFVDLQKVADAVWADFTGNDKLTNEQFKKYLEQEMRRRTEGKYDDRFLLVFTVNFTQVDQYNGFSWTLNIDVGAENMKTVQQTVLSGYRRDVLAAQTGANA